MRGLVDALRTHLVEREAETIRRRRHPAADDDELTGRSSTASRHLDDRQSLQHPPPPPRRRLRLTPASLHPLRRNRSRAARRHVQSVRWRSKYDSCRNASEAVSRDASSLSADTSSRAVAYDDDATTAARGDKSEQENMNDDDLRQCASQLSSLASRDLRVGRLLTELFQLMDSDDDH